MEKLKDSDLMPFGKYKDKILSEVPNWYLAYLKIQIKEKAPNKQSLAEKMILKYAEKREEEASELPPTLKGRGFG
jgi:uncharacterized protein (DUF3820 family)